MDIPSKEELLQGIDDGGVDDGSYVTNPPVNTDFAKLSLKGTSTTNPERPRTIAAGYDKVKRIMTVVFRGNIRGTIWWNYYDVPPELWEEFEWAESKGRFLRDSGLDNWPDMGPVNMNAMRPSQRNMLDWVAMQARDAQIRSGGDQVYGDPRQQGRKTIRQFKP